MEKVTGAAIKAYVTLEQARYLNNKVISDHAFVYDQFEGIEYEVKASNAFELAAEFDKFLALLPDPETPLQDNKFILVPTKNFDSAEQVEHLKKNGKFYYAPLSVTEEEF